MIKIIKQSEYHQKLWKNGRGSTQEIAISCAGEEFDWRLSMAGLIESGPFSRFPGMERILVLLEGPEVLVSHSDNGKQHTLVVQQPYHFSGDWDTQAVVTGVGRDFNLIYRRDKFVGEVLVESYPQPQHCVIEEQGLSAIFCLDGKILTELGELGPYDTLLVDHQRLRIETCGQTRLINVQLRSIHQRTPREF